MTQPTSTQPTTGRPIPKGRVVVLRHGPTEWSDAGKHTGLTDLSLTSHGEDVARKVAPRLAEYDFIRVLTSPMERARRTAELAGLTDAVVEPHLVEWDYGGYEGRTTPEIREELGYPWNVWTDGVVPGDTPGETIEQVSARVRDVIDAITPYLDRGDVCLVAHGHTLRILAATWLRKDLRFGAQLPLDAGCLGVLGYEREDPALMRWNVPG